MDTPIKERLQIALRPWLDVCKTIEHALEGIDDDAPQALWPRVAACLSPMLPDECHLAAHRAVFADWDDNKGPAPTWFPDHDALTQSNAAQFCAGLNYASWNDLHAASIADRPAFWSEMIRRLGIRFATPPTAILAQPADPCQPNWLPGAELNITQSCFSLSEETPAIRWGKEDGTIEEWSCQKLQSLAAQITSGLRSIGLVPGDTVAIDMPMTPESVAIYLGIIHAGMAVVSVADSFAPQEIATRLRIGQAKLVVTQDVIARKGKQLPLYTKVVEAGARRCVVVARDGQLAVDLRPDDIAFDAFLGDCECPVHQASPEDTINILFSSGTTGDPKAIPWSHTTPIKCATDGHLHLDIRPGDVVCWPTNLGWMMGPWLIFAALMNRATIALFDGAPMGQAFAKFIEGAQVTMLGIVPSMVKNWRATDAFKDADLAAIRCFGSTGECSNSDDYFWLSSRAGYRPVIEYCGGTEIGGAYITGNLLQPQAPSTFSTPAVGTDLVLINESGQADDQGETFLIPPSIGMSTKLLNRDHHEVYYDNCPDLPEVGLLRRHGDRLVKLASGYFRADGRADDTMNLGGIKVSSAEIEQAVGQAENVKDVAAVSIPPVQGGPDGLVVFVVALDPQHVNEADTLKEMRGLIRATINPLFHLTRVVFVPTMPRTASNKIMRRKLRAFALD